ncbi:hypothetical protein P775_08425 [Puniceibacterium antarcticum]|uniref:Uncharacterized protein n=1 Tax=Puniceibacterium antarcticum TaxID=1206336 RepID=A0A2G8RG36_9RHOB|nr:hypothetical protein [Puniceibacterium antarcticum]PIL20545.1 hypothetical protein P775_08425 [Puniceibacterium antarcticum]
MTATRPPQVAWSSGELDPLLHAREDFQRHQTGLAICRGFLPLRQGGFTRAPGTIFRGTTRGNSVAVRVPFVFSTSDAQALEFSDGKMRVWRYGVLVLSGGVPYEIDTPFTAADLANLNYLQDADVMYLVDGRNPMQQLSRFAIDNWTLAEAELDAGPFRVQNLDEDRTIQVTNGAGSGAITAWVANANLIVNDIRKFGLRVYRYKGTGETIGVATDGSVGPNPPSHAAGTVASTVTPDPGATYAFWEFLYDTSVKPGDTNVTLSAVGDLFTPEHLGVVYLLEPTDWLKVPIWTGNVDVNNGQLVRYDGNVYELSLASNTGVNPPVHTSGTVQTDLNRSTRYRHVSTEIGVVKITEVLDANTALADVIKAVPQPCIDDPTYRWSEGAWNDIYGNPRHIALHQQRLFAARTETEPRTITASTIAAYRDFEPGDEDDSSFSYDIGGVSSKNEINWLISGKRGIYIGSLGGVRLGSSGGRDEPITLATFRPEVVATDGAAAVQPALPYGWPVYVTRDKSRVMETRYNFSEDDMSPVELSLPSQHLGNPGFEQIVWQPSPYQRGWFRRGDGTLACLIYDPKENVLGWAPVPVAGGFVEHMDITPSEDSRYDILTMIVRRIIDGETVRCIEEQALNVLPMNGASGVENFNHAFCSAEFSPASPTSEFSMPHLAGEIVSAWTDRGSYDGLNVAPDGGVILPDPVSHAFIGLFDDTHRVRTLSIRADAKDGDTRGRKRRLQKGSALILHRTAGGFVAAVERSRAEQEYVGSQTEILPYSVGEQMARDANGIVEIDIQSGEAHEVAIEFTPDGLKPMTITGLVPNIEEVGG